MNAWLQFTPSHAVLVAAILFGIGAAGAIIRRNALVLLMSVELMLNAANIVFVAYAKQYGDPHGHALAFFVMAIAAAEAAVGLAIFLGVFRTRQTLDVSELDVLRDDV
ncbi:MAG: NADH-quinone oxidoreductase subunit NuoK [Myxococcota bacterium]